jgi:hypothetical protein
MSLAQQSWQQERERVHNYWHLCPACDHNVNLSRSWQSLCRQLRRKYKEKEKLICLGADEVHFRPYGNGGKLTQLERPANDHERQLAMKAVFLLTCTACRILSFDITHDRLPQTSVAWTTDFLLSASTHASERE